MPWADPWSRAGATYRPRGVVPPGAGEAHEARFPEATTMLEFWFYPAGRGERRRQPQGKGVATFWLNRHRSRERAKGGEYEFLPPAPKYRSVKAAFARRPQAVARV